MPIFTLGRHTTELTSDRPELAQMLPTSLSQPAAVETAVEHNREESSSLHLMKLVRHRMTRTPSSTATK
jgi:hypothetical protein